MKSVDTHRSDAADDQSRAARVAIEALDQSLEQIPPDIERRLRQQRLALMNQPPKLDSWWSGWRWPMALASSVVLVASGYLVLVPTSEPLVSTATQVAAATEMGDLIELYEIDQQDWDMLQDLDFAIWLSELPDENLPLDRAG